MKKIFLLSLIGLLAASESNAVLLRYKLVVNFGSTVPSNTVLNVHVDNVLLGIWSTTVTGNPGETVTSISTTPYSYNGTLQASVISYGWSGGLSELASPSPVSYDGDGYYTFVFNVGTEYVQNFETGVQVDTQAQVYYRTAATGNSNALMSANSLALETPNANPLSAETWLTRSTLAAAKVNEYSRNITWHMVLYDKTHEPYRDAAGNVVIFTVSPEWRRRSELYGATP